MGIEKEFLSKDLLGASNGIAPLNSSCKVPSDYISGGGSGGGGTEYIYSDQFTVENGNVVFMGDHTEEIKSNISHIYEETNKSIPLLTISNGTGRFASRGKSRGKYSGSTYGGNYGSKAFIVSSIPFTIDSYDKSDIMIDSVEIPSLFIGEYIDEQGYVYKFANTPPRVANNPSTDICVKANPDLDINVITLNCRYCDGSTLYGDPYSGTETDKNGKTITYLKLYQFTSTATSFDFENTPIDDDDVPEFYITYINGSTELHIPPYSYNEFMSTTDTNISALKKKEGIWYVYLKMGSDAPFSGFTDATNIVRKRTLFAPIIKKGSTPTKSATPIDNSILLKSGGKISVRLTESVSSLSDFPDKLFLKHNAYAPLEKAAYYDINLGDKAIGHNGILKHTIIGATSTNIGTYSSDASDRAAKSLIRQGCKHTPVIGTKGILKTNDHNYVTTPELFCFNGISDEVTESYYMRIFSNPVFIKDAWYDSCYPFIEPDSSGEIDPNLDHNAIYRYKIPIVDLIEVPKQNSASNIANFLNQANMPVADDTIEGLKSIISREVYTPTQKIENAYYRQYISFTYTGGDYAYLKFIGQSPYTYSLTNKETGINIIRKAISTSGFSIKYELATPVYLYDVDKLFANTGETTSWVTTTGYNAYGKISLQSPKNAEGALDMLKPIAQDVTSLNNRVVAVEGKAATIGVGDGSTDNYAIFTDALASSTDIEIGEGVYVLSQPIVINNPNTTISGFGNAVLVCPSGQPAIKIAASFTTIRNLSFRISKTEDGVTETDNGLHSGIYVVGLNDSAQGLYDIKIQDCDFQGAHRWSTLDKEYSYGIYFVGNTDGDYRQSYFNIINNCRFFALRTGLYVGRNTQPSNIYFEFDQGKNIYSISGLGSAEISKKKVTNALGCKYGCELHSTSNIVRFLGQFVGDDTITPITTIDDDGNVTSFSRCNISDCAVLVDSKHNYIEGFSYDIQRATSGYVRLTTEAVDNRVNLLYASFPSYTQDQITYTKDYLVYRDSEPAGSINHIKYNTAVSFRMFTDNGFLNTVQTNKKFSNLNYNIAGSGVDKVNLATGDIIRNPFPDMIGTQDDSSAYLIEAGGSVEVYTKTGDVKTTYSNVSAEFAKLFNPKYYRNYEGIMLKDDNDNMLVPTESNPVYIEIHFNKAYDIDKFFINFNDYIADKFDVYSLKTSSYTPVNGAYFEKNNRSYIEAAPFNVSPQMRHIRSCYYWYNSSGMLIKIYSGASVGDYNPNGYVGLSRISILDSNKGGNAFISKGDETIYGSLTVPYLIMPSEDGTKNYKVTINNGNFKLSEITN